MVCDSNIIIYASNLEDTVCIPYVRQTAACIASVTRIETLGFPRFHLMDDARKVRLIELVASLPEVALNEGVIQRAIALRRARAMSLADSIIAATALERGMSLVTRNVEDYKHIDGLRLINPFD